jgi:thymidine phosphorylase
VDSVPLIAASIMSKKIAEGAGALVLDVKTGRGAFMRREDEAGHLAGRMVAIGRSAGVRTEALITAMDVPLGRAVGNALEVAESLDVLRGNGAEDLSALCRALAVRMLTLAGLAATDEEAGRRVDEAIASGRALERFARMVDAQGGDPAVVDDPARLPAAPGRATVAAPRAGYLTGLDAELVGHAAVALGAGRSRAEDRVDPAVGLTLHAKPGDPLALGQPIVEIHYRDEASRDRAQALVASAIAVGDEPPAPGRLVRRRLS